MRTNSAKKAVDTPKNKGGRPPKQIDLDQVKQLAALQCTDWEICSVLGISQDTFARRKADPEFAQMMEQGKAMGKLSLRRAHFKLAQTNPAVHIFACKNWLGMSDKVDVVGEDVGDKARQLLDAVKAMIDTETDK